MPLNGVSPRQNSPCDQSSKPAGLPTLFQQREKQPPVRGSAGQAAPGTSGAANRHISVRSNRRHLRRLFQ
jgi:hypothetical protein